MDESTWSVYMHQSPSGKRYIGITGGALSKRWAGGSGYRKNPIFYRAILKYGWDNIAHVVLASGLSRGEAVELEKFYIQLFRSNDRRFGYNATAGGDGCNGSPRSEETKALLRAKCSGWKHSPEALEKIRQRSKEMWLDPELRARMTGRGPEHWNYGKKRSPETVAKMVASRAGYKHTPEWIAWAKERFSGEGNPNYGRVFGEDFRKIQHDKMVELMKDPERRQHLRDSFPRKWVRQIDLSGRIVAEYDGIHEAERSSGVAAGNISQSCRGKRKSAGGYRWEFFFEG